MAFFTVTTDAKELAKEEGGSFIKDSGIYDVVIKRATVSVSKGGSTAIDFSFEYNGSETTIYGLRLTNNDGTKSFQASIFNALCIVAGVESVDDPVMEEVKMFDGSTKELPVLQEFTDKEVKVWLQKEWSQWNGVIRGRLTIKRFYDAVSGKTSSEIIQGLPSTKLAKDTEYATQDKYKDGLTKETAIATPKGQSASTATTATAPAANPFAK